MRPLVLVAAITLWISPPALAQAPVAGQKSAVQQFIRGYIKAHNDADATSLMDAVSHDAAVSSISDGEITRGWDAIRTSTDEITGLEGRFKLAIGTMDVSMLGGDYALVTAPTTITVAGEKGELQFSGAATWVLRKKGVGWLVVHEHYSTKVAS